MNPMRPSQLHALVPARAFVFLASVFLLLGLLAEASPDEVQSSPTTPIAIPAGRKADSVAILPIHGPIDGVTTRSLERRLAEAKADGCDAVVLELDTPGGDLLATYDILELIRTRAPANTVAWIRPKAFSAGTIIALSTREIITTPSGVFGDAAPIQGLPVVGLRQLPAAERAKIEAPLLSEVVYDARRQGWDEKLVQSFVAVDVELWLIRNKRTGDRLFVDAPEYERIFGEPPTSTGLARLPSVPSRDPLTGLLGTADPDEPVPTASERDATIEFLQDLPSRRPTLGPEDAEDWVSLGQVVTRDELLVLRADEAAAYGFTSAQVADDRELLAFFGATSATRYDTTWSEGLVRFLTLWPVRAVLIAVLLIGFFIETAAPGYGAFGLVSIAALALLLGAPLLAGMAEWWTVAVVLIGLMLAAFELFLLPGFGVAGVAGGICIFVGLVGTFVGGRPFDDGVRDGLVHGLLATTIGFIGGGVGIWLLLRNIPRLSFASRIVLADAVGVGIDDSTGRPAPAPMPTIGTIIPKGSEGVVVSPLRTSGRVRFGDRLIDAQSVGAYIDRGTRVRVVSSDDFGVKVERSEP
jgi:membrane-bound serine protease (ClpP class)